MNKLVVVMSETFKKHFFSKIFLAMMIIPVVIAVISLVISGLNNKEVKKVDIVVSDNQAGQEITKDFPNIYNQVIQNENDAKKRLQDGQNNGYLKIESENNQRLVGNLYSSKANENMLTQVKSTLTDLQTALNYQNANLSENQLKVIQTIPEINAHSNSETIDYKAILIAMAVLFIIYFISLTYSSMFAQEIGSEKGNKVMEMILSVVSARTYFYGKFLGMVSLLITNILFYVGCFLLLLLFGKHVAIFESIISQVEMFLQSDVWQIFIIDGLMLILGTSIFLLIATFCGIAVTKQEDINKSSSVVLMVILILFSVSMGLISTGDFSSFGLFGPILAIIPASSAFFLPIWVALGQAPIWAIGLAIILNILAIFGLSLFFAKCYEILSLYKGNNPIKHILKTYRQN